MITPYLLYREALPCGRLAWRRMINPLYTQTQKIITTQSKDAQEKRVCDGVGNNPKQSKDKFFEEPKGIQ